MSLTCATVSAPSQARLKRLVQERRESIQARRASLAERGKKKAEPAEFVHPSVSTPHCVDTGHINDDHQCLSLLLGPDVDVLVVH